MEALYHFSHSVFHSSHDTHTINSDLHGCGESEKQDGRLDSLEWNGGMDWIGMEWNGT